MEKGGTPKFQAKTLDHIHIVAKDTKKVTEIWEQMFGIGPWTFRWGIAFAYMDNGVELCVSAPWRDNQPEGVDHFGFFVDDVEAEIANLEAQGAKLTGHEPGFWAYLDSGVAGSGGVIEVIKRHEPFQD